MLVFAGYTSPKSTETYTIGVDTEWKLFPDSNPDPYWTGGYQMVTATVNNEVYALGNHRLVNM